MGPVEMENHVWPSSAFHFTYLAAWCLRAGTSLTLDSQKASISNGGLVGLEYTKKPCYTLKIKIQLIRIFHTPTIVRGQLLAISVKSESTDVGKQCKTTANANASEAVMSHSENAGSLYQGRYVLRAGTPPYGTYPITSTARRSSWSSSMYRLMGSHRLSLAMILTLSKPLLSRV